MCGLRRSVWSAVHNLRIAIIIAKGSSRHKRLDQTAAVFKVRMNFGKIHMAGPRHRLRGGAPPAEPAERGSSPVFIGGPDKKGPPGDARRAAQAGGILESFLDYLTPRGAVL